MEICEGKIKEMQKYVPFLGNLIENLKKDKTNIAKLSQMQLLYNLLTKPDKGITLNTLVKCEEVLEKVFGNSTNKEIDKPQMSDKEETEDNNAAEKTEEECSSKPPEDSALLNNGSKEANVSSDQEDSQVSEDTSLNQEACAGDVSPECILKENIKLEPDDHVETPTEEMEVDQEENNQESSCSPTTECESDVSNKKIKEECSEVDDEEVDNEASSQKDETKVTSNKETEDDETLEEDTAEIVQQSQASTPVEDERSDENLEETEKIEENVKMEVEGEGSVKEEIKEECHDVEEEKEELECPVVEGEEGEEEKCADVEEEEEEEEEKCAVVEEEEEDEKIPDVDKEEKEEECPDVEEAEKEEEQTTKLLQESNDSPSPEDGRSDENLEDIKEIDDKEKKEEESVMEIEEDSVDIEETREICQSEEHEEIAEEIVDKKVVGEKIETSKQDLKISNDTKIDEDKELHNEINLIEDSKENNCKVTKKKSETPPKEIRNSKENDEDKVPNEKEVTEDSKASNCKVLRKKSVTPPKEIPNSTENDILPISDDDDNLLVPLSNSATEDNLESVEKDPPTNPVKFIKPSPTKPNKSDTINNSIDSKIHSPDELSKLKLSESDSIKKIELKPKGPTDKPAVVYFIKKNPPPKPQPQPVETIELLESDSDDDDVILVSEVGLKKRPTPKIIMVPKGTRLVPRPKSVLQQQLQHKPPPRVLNKLAPVNTSRINKPMFAIANVESISPKVNNATSTPMKAANSSSNVINQRKPASKLTPPPPPSPAKPVCKILHAYTKQVSTDTSVDGSLNGSPDSENSKDVHMNKEWLENFLTNLLSPTQIKSTHAMDMLQAVLDRKTFDQIKDIVQQHDECASDNSDIEIEIDKNTEAIREIFIKKGVMTDVGRQLCSLASQDGSSVFTTDRRNGQVTSKSRRSRNKPNNDDEYAPNVMLCLDEEVVSERRRSLRRESKLNRKQYFAYDNEDDEEFIRYIDEQARIQSNNNKKKKTQKRPANETKETKSKRQRFKKNVSIDTVETELLTPTWMEDDSSIRIDCDAELGQPDDSYEQPQSAYERSSRFQGNINPDFGGDDDESDDDDNPDAERKPKVIDETSRHTKAPIWPFKNINRIYHCRSDYVDTCLICNTKIQFVVSHYVNQHRESEVIISRLTKKDVAFLVRNVNHGFLSTQRNTNHIYASTCIFCKRNMSFALRYWWEHYTMHTGEYGYECNKCFLRRPRRQHAQKHANDCRVGTMEPVVKIVYDFDKKTNKIEAYICKLCNFIQLHRDNLVKHLETQHDFTTVPEIAENMIKVVLLQISRPYSDPAILTNETFQDMANEIAAAYPGLDQNSIDLQSQFMQYTDDLSFAICDMLAADDDDDGQGNIVTGDQLAESQQQEYIEDVGE